MSFVAPNYPIRDVQAIVLRSVCLDNDSLFLMRSFLWLYMTPGCLT